MPTATAPDLTRVRSGKLNPRRIAQGRNNGRCQLTGIHSAPSDFSHRLAAGRRGPMTYGNGLHLYRVVHDALNGAQDLAKTVGWVVESEADPDTIPALCICDDQPGWWWLNPHGDGRVAYATRSEVTAAGLDPTMTLPRALDLFDQHVRGLYTNLARQACWAPPWRQATGRTRRDGAR